MKKNEGKAPLLKGNQICPLTLKKIFIRRFITNRCVNGRYFARIAARPFCHERFRSYLTYTWMYISF
ncbi:hypothetical protein FRX31_028892 [Thalictrum thalictroides]|uniref:Uncharacterized protein n=1 Tax=Thalictrum thalictroides TaxID=46969 RepID=A0A7J6VA94_THATH|nr:hypothetical protein FRX31_028892 [Thalictrum thalictroides]